MARQDLTSGTATSDATAFETDAFQPSSNSLILLFVTSARPVLGGGVPKPPAVTGNGLRWVAVGTVLYGANTDRRLTCFRASGPGPVGGSAVIDFTGETQDFCAWSIFEYSGVDVSGADGSSAITQFFPVTTTGQSLTASLSQSADPGRNVAVGALAVDSASGAGVDVAEGAGYTEIDELKVTQFLSKAGTLQTQDAGAANTVISWTWGSTQSAAALVLEVRAAPPAGPGTGPGTGTGSQPGTTVEDDRALVERFEPVLFFHPSEKFFPSDAKRFVERAALWTAQRRGDDKSGWGGAPGDPFPRTPTVPAGGLAATPGESGDFRFAAELGGNDHRFLEIGGWKDLSEAHEDDVTGLSSNRFSDRTEIEALYAGTLEPSRYWYHAEVIHEKRLLDIGRRAPGNLEPVVAQLSDPTLLCYYFFFPAHDQGVDIGSCGNLEAREISSHAGDWQCLAILGSGTGSDFVPKFLGRTGLRPAGEEGRFPPHQYDDDGNTAIVVGPYSPADPEVTEGHPRLYVAAGTHSLQLAPGAHRVDPYPAGRQPQHCGTLDTPTPAGPDEDDAVTAAKDIAILLAKMIAAGPFGFLGAAAALVGVVAEVASYRSPMAPFGVDPVSAGNPDQAPTSPGEGRTVRPPGLNVPDAGTDVVEWRCRPRQPLALDGRTYDCLVDRATQGWWPDPDSLRGFRGRWGQHVTADALSRRAGPRFPDYPRMFLQALADGAGRTPPSFVLGG